MGIFNSIKKSRRASSDIDEKIEYLNKELEKTGLREAMTTSNMYVSGGREPNQQYSDFEATSINGYGLGISGGDGNGAGDAYVGTITADMRLGHAYTGMQGVAISPPHPVTGQRRYATTQTGFAGVFSPLTPGKAQRGFPNNDYVSGGAIWYWVPNHNNGLGQVPGLWFNLEFNTSNGKWSFWDTNFLGFFFLNQNLDALEHSGSNVGTVIKNQISSINFGTKGEIGTPQTLVLTKNNLDDPGFLPINIDGLSTQGFNYLKDKANVASNYYSVEDKKNVINYYKKLKADPNYQPKPFERDSLMRQMRAQGDGVEIASTDPSVAFPSAPSPDTPTDTNQGEGPKPSKAKGTDAKLGKWMSRTDFMALYPNSSMTEYLNALPYGGTNFMKPDPNFPNARIVDTDAYEKYFMTGDTSGLSDSKPKHKETPEVEYTPQELKKGFSANQILNYLKTKFNSPLGPATDIIADVVADTFGQRGSKAILDDYTRNFVPALLSGKNVAGKTSGNPRNVGNMYSDKAIKDYEEIYKDYQKEKRGEKDLKGLDLPWTNKYTILQDANSEIGNTTGTLDPEKAGDGFVDNGDGTETLIKRYDFDNLKDMAGSNVASNLGALTYGVISGIPSLLGKGESGRTPSAYIGITFDKKTGKVIKNYKKGIAESLDESVKLGHFEPEQLNVNIEDLRKGIMPEFPKDPPPEMVDGYNPKSRLAPKKLERSSFIKITKKDLAKNHRLKDSEIKDFMDTINAVNEFIKKHPEELIYAQTRYPKNDPRLAQLNWEMDQKLNASKEYMDKHYPENQKLFTKIQKSIKKNIELTDPKSFKGVEVPKFEGVDLTDFKRRKEVVARHYKKAVKVKKLFSRKKT